MAASILLLFVAFITVAAVAGRIDPPRVTTTASTPRTPAHGQRARLRGPERALIEEFGKRYCIGGSMCPDYCERPVQGCEAQPFYSLQLERPARISRIALYARDEIVLTRPAELLVKLDGQQLGKFPVQGTGSSIRIPVNRIAQHITIESRDPHGIRKSGEEAIISEVQVFGRELE
jgi:hypothetical protein